MIYEYWENRTQMSSEYYPARCGKHYLLWETKDLKSLQETFSRNSYTYIRVLTDDHVETYIINNMQDWYGYIGDFYDMRYNQALNKESEMAITKEEMLKSLRKNVKMIIHKEVNPEPVPEKCPVEHTLVVERPSPAEQTVDNNPKTLVALSKPRLSDVPPVALFALGAAMSDGAHKYGRFNYRDTSVTSSVFYDAMMRHLTAWYSGEDYANDSKVHHLAHLMASCAILLDGELHGKLNDDRSKGINHLISKIWKDNE